MASEIWHRSSRAEYHIIFWPKQFDELTKATFLNPNTDRNTWLYCVWSIFFEQKYWCIALLLSKPTWSCQSKVALAAYVTPVVYLSWSYGSPLTLFRQRTVLVRLLCLFLLFCQVLQYRFLVLLANTLIAIMPLSSSPKIFYLHLLRGIRAQLPSIDRQLLAGKQGHKSHLCTTKFIHLCTGKHTKQER